ncbi:hypothetical protein FACS1894152_3290 [Bacilli bacterium]|nr:hypothetical protein FACS1894152_3290 [Bacilli bacterium]
MNKGRDAEYVKGLMGLVAPEGAKVAESWVNMIRQTNHIDGFERGFAEAKQAWGRDFQSGRRSGIKLGVLLGGSIVTGGYVAYKFSSLLYYRMFSTEKDK